MDLKTLKIIAKVFFAYHLILVAACVSIIIEANFSSSIMDDTVGIFTIGMLLVVIYLLIFSITLWKLITKKVQKGEHYTSRLLTCFVFSILPFSGILLFIMFG